MRTTDGDNAPASTRRQLVWFVIFYVAGFAATAAIVYILRALLFW